MARIDALLEQMRAGFVDRAILQSDVATQFHTSSGVSQGQVLAAAEVESLASEILAPQESLQLQNTGQVTVSHAGFQIAIYRVNGILRLVATAAQSSVAPGFVNEPNDSGQGKSSVAPAQIQGFNWGAFLLSWIWAIGNKTWIGLLGIVPIIGFFMRFVLGFKGNEWAWQNRRFPSIADFKKAQKNWALAGLVVLGCGVMSFPITAAVLFPVFARARENARKSSCQNNLKLISIGVMQWSLAHGDRYPTASSNETLRDMLVPIVKDAKVFVCPSDTAEDGTSDYQYNFQLSGVGTGDVNDPAATPMLWDKPGIDHLDGGNIAFADGHVKWFHKNEFDAWTQPAAQ